MKKIMGSHGLMRKTGNVTTSSVTSAARIATLTSTTSLASVSSKAGYALITVKIAGRFTPIHAATPSAHMHDAAIARSA